MVSHPEADFPVALVPRRGARPAAGPRGPLARECSPRAGSDPALPASENHPKIIGTADAGTTITLYTTLDCTGSVAATP